MMGRFLRIGGVWVRHVFNSCNFDPRTRLGVKCKEQLAEPRKKEPFLKQQSFERQMWNLGKTNSAKPWWNLDETLVEPWQDLGGTFAEPWSNLPQNLLAAQHGSAPENAPKPLLWLKLLLLGNKNLSNQHSTYDKGAGNINYLKYGTIYSKLTKLMELHSTNRCVLAGQQVASHKMSYVNWLLEVRSFYPINHYIYHDYTLKSILVLQLMEEIRLTSWYGRFLPAFTKFYTCQVVIWDFHQLYIWDWININTIWTHLAPHLHLKLPEFSPPRGPSSWWQL